MSLQTIIKLTLIVTVMALLDGVVFLQLSYRIWQGCLFDVTFLASFTLQFHDLNLLYSFSYFLSLAFRYFCTIVIQCLSPSFPPLKRLFILLYHFYSHLANTPTHVIFNTHTHSNTNNALSLLFAFHPRALLKTFPCHAFWPYKYTHTHTSVVVNLKLSNSKTQADYLIFICRPLMKALHLPLTQPS